MNKKGISTVQGVIVVIVVIAIVAGVGAWYFMGGEEEPTNGGPTNGDNEPTNGGPEVPDTIKIGAVLPLTGDLATWGSYLDFGYQYIIDKINDEGGIYVEEYDEKIPIQYIKYDDESTPERATSLAERLATQDEVVAILGSGTPLLGGPVASTGERLGVPTLHAATPLEVMQGAIPPETRKWSWDVFFSIMDPKIGFVASAYNTLEYYDVESNGKINSFCDTTPDGNGFRGAVGALAGQFGYEVVYEPELIPGQGDFSTQINKAKGNGADILLGLMLPSDGWSMWRQAETYGWKPKFAAMFKTAEPSEWWKELGETGEGMCHGLFWHPTLPWPGTQELADAWEEETGEMWSLHLGDGAAITQVLANAIEKAGTLDRADINNAIKTTDMMTVAGPVKFDLEGPYNHQSKLACGLYQWVDGKRVIVWYPPKSDTGPEYPTQEEAIQDDLVYPME